MDIWKYFFFVYLTCIKIYAPNATPQNIILFFVEKKIYK